MITLYTTHCPKCVVLEKKLQQKGIEYNTVEEIAKMEQLGIYFTPALEVDKKVMNFTNAIAWVNEQ